MEGKTSFGDISYCRNSDILNGSVKMVKYLNKSFDEKKFFDKWYSFFDTVILPMIKDLDDSQESVLKFAERLRIYLKDNVNLQYKLKSNNWLESFMDFDVGCNCVCGTMLFLALFECVGYFPKYVYGMSGFKHIWIEMHEPKGYIIETTNLECEYTKQHSIDGYAQLLSIKLLTASDVLYHYFDQLIMTDTTKNIHDQYIIYLSAPEILGIESNEYWENACLSYLYAFTTTLEETIKLGKEILTKEQNIYSLRDIYNVLFKLRIIKDYPKDSYGEIALFIFEIMKWLKDDYKNIINMHHKKYIEILSLIRSMTRVDCLQYIHGSKQLSIDNMITKKLKYQDFIDVLAEGEYLTSYEQIDVYGKCLSNINLIMNYNYGNDSEKIGVELLKYLPWIPNRWEYVLVDMVGGTFDALKLTELLLKLYEIPNKTDDIKDMIVLIKKDLDIQDDTKHPFELFKLVGKLNSKNSVQELYASFVDELKTIAREPCTDLIRLINMVLTRVSLIIEDMDNINNELNAIKNIVLTAMGELNSIIRYIPISDINKLIECATVIRELTRIDCIQYIYNSETLSMYNVCLNPKKYKNIIELCVTEHYLTVHEYFLKFGRKISAYDLINWNKLYIDVSTKYLKHSLTIGKYMVKGLPWKPKFLEMELVVEKTDSNEVKIRKYNELKEKLLMELSESRDKNTERLRYTINVVNVLIHDLSDVMTSGGRKKMIKHWHYR